MVSDDEFEYSADELDDDDVDWEDVTASQQTANSAALVVHETAIHPDVQSNDAPQIDWDEVNRALAEHDVASATRKRRRPSMRLTKAEKHREKALHQTHLLLLLATRIKWTQLSRSHLLQGLLLSLLTTSALDLHATLREQPLSYSLMLLIRWFHQEFQVIKEDSFQGEKMTDNGLLNVFFTRKGHARELTVLFAALCGAFQLRYRLTSALNPVLIQRSQVFESTFRPENNNKRQRVTTQRRKDENERECENELKGKTPVALIQELLWCEVLDETTRTWRHVDVIHRYVDQPEQVEALQGQAARLSYVLSVQDNGLLVDVTSRYTAQWSKSVNLRLAHTWLQEVVERANDDTKDERKVLKDTEAVRQKEIKHLERLKLAEGMPTSLEGFKKHHLYVLERHLTQFESLYPRHVVGLFNGQPVFRREHVQPLQSAFKWRRCGRVVKESERHCPAKWHSRSNSLVHASSVDEDSQTVKDSLVALFGQWQTIAIERPELIDGYVPKNKYGNIELWSPAHIPKCAVHLRLPRIDSIATSLGIDYAPAVVGFAVRNGRPMPKISGIVVAQIHEATLRDAHAVQQQHTIDKAIDWNQKLVLRRWAKLVKRLLLRQRLDEDYGAV